MPNLSTTQGIKESGDDSHLYLNAPFLFSAQAVINKK